MVGAKGGLDLQISYSVHFGGQVLLQILYILQLRDVLEIKRICMFLKTLEVEQLLRKQTVTIHLDQVLATGQILWHGQFLFHYF
jgi:hypothetical protein